MAIYDDWEKLPVSSDEEAISVADIDEASCAKALRLEDVLALLRSPDKREALSLCDGRLASASGEEFDQLGRRPLLLPRAARALIRDGAYRFPPEAATSAFSQYLLIASIKAEADIQNLDHSDIWYRRNLHRGRKLFANARGLMIDIGCDAPSVSRRFYPPTVQFLGIEPSLRRSDEFSLCAMAERLPIAESSADNVALNSSLDHILDYHLAIDEAVRILKPGGMFYMNSLIWTKRAELFPDTVHFHHFRDYELRGALKALTIEEITRYSWKGDSHRYGVYLAARKP